MSAKYWLQKLGLVVLCAAVLVGAAGKSWGEFYVIPVTSMTFKGDWNAATVYKAKDVVFYDGSSWFSLAGNNQGHTPEVASAYWTLVARKGDPGPAGPSKVLKTQVFTSAQNIGFIPQTVPTDMENSTWTYTKVSATSKLIITYQDTYEPVISGEYNLLFARILVNGYKGDTNYGACLIIQSPGANLYASSTGLWSDVPQGDVTLSVSTNVLYPADYWNRNSIGAFTLLVMEVEP